MAALALLSLPIAHVDHFKCRRNKHFNFRSHSIHHRTRTLASRNQWNIEISRGLLPQTSLADVAELLAAAFRDSGGDDADDDTEEETVNPVYKLRLMAALQFRALTEGRQYVTVIARSTETGNVAGVVTLAPGLGPADADGHFSDFPEDQTIASISNMAVEEHSRRQGLGKILLETVEIAGGGWPVPPSLYALSVYKTNEAAIQLYKTSGYAVDDTWTDPKWLHAAERGLASCSRRLLMVKKVTGWETASESEQEDG
jgi:ribosomal protein S18 acetylase RimI-like enzyme